MFVEKRWCTRHSALIASGSDSSLIEVRDLRREQQSFIDDRARRERRDVEEALVLHLGRREHFVFGALADDVELALERRPGPCPERTRTKICSI